MEIDEEWRDEQALFTGESCVLPQELRTQALGLSLALDGTTFRAGFVAVSLCLVTADAPSAS